MDDNVSNIKKIAQLMAELAEQLEICTHCGMCQAFCPLFAQTGFESDVARGKLALLDGLTHELFKSPEGVCERLNKCLLCGSCEFNCPRGTNVLEIFLKARVILTGFIGLSPVKKTVLRRILARPKTFDRLVKLASKFQNIFTRPASEPVGISCRKFALPLRQERNFVSIAPAPFHHMAPSLRTTSGSSGIKVAFFVGCLIDKIFPDVAKAVLKVLDYHGVGVFMPEGQGCCGIPAVSSGDAVAFNRLIRHNLDIFEAADFDYLVTACATCTFTIKKIWPMMIQMMVRKESANIKSRVRKIAEKTLDINQFLVSKIGLQNGVSGRDAKAVSVTYHDPCHLKKSLGISSEPRALIKANPLYRFTEMPEADVCCGMGGSFNLQYYNISTKIGRQKYNNIKISGCSTVATGCPACMIQISDMISRLGGHIAVKHPVEIYAESLKN